MAKKSKALVSVKDQLAKYAQETESREKNTGGASISVKGGKFIHGEDELPQPLTVVVVDDVFENRFYKSIYDPDDPQPPACYALGKIQDEMQPVEDSPEIQSESCFDCPNNEWGSAMRGRGKACANIRRLALLPAIDLDLINEDTEPAILRISPTALKAFSGLFKKISKVYNLPPCGVTIDLGTEQVNDDYWTVRPSNPQPIEDATVLSSIIKIREDVTPELLSAGYDFSTYEAEKSKKKGGARKKKSSKF